MKAASLPEELPKSAPEVFLDYQKKLMSTVAANAVTIYEKSRRTGISWAIAADAALTAAADRKAGGMDVIYMSYNQEMTREFIDYVALFAKHFAIAAEAMEEFLWKGDEDRDIKAFRIQFASGFEVIALSSVPRNLRGKQGKVIIDEAAFIDNLQEVLKAAFALLIWGGKVVVISTHDGIDNPFNELVNDVRSGRKPYALLRTTFADAIEDGLYRRVCLLQGKEWTAEGEAQWTADIRAFYGDGADEELDCVPSKSGGTYFPSVLIESRMDPTAPVLRLALDNSFMLQPEEIRKGYIRDWCNENLAPLLAKLPRWESFLGEDFGRTGDLTVLWPVQIDPTLVRRTPFTVELRNVPFEAQKQILYFLCDGLPRFRAGAFDGGGNGQYLAEVATQRYGASRIFTVYLTSHWYLENFPKYKADLEEDKFTLPLDNEILADHRAVVMEKGVPRVPDVRTVEAAGAAGGQAKKAAKRHGDAAIAALLADFAARQSPAPIEYEEMEDTRIATTLGDFLEGAA